ncbi:MAG TPA: helix-turn-helix domain-containing protein [Firmicutes bacterium]|nr:helix-turn-helix domain-containing protein [Candidatus Fermentithermobacillaceae bacterium]
MRILKMVLVPDALVDTKDLSVGAKYLRAVAEVKSHASLAELARLAGVSRSAALQACHSLTKHGWVALSNTGNSRIAVPCYPDEIERLRIEMLLWEKDMAPFLGEFLMRKILDEIVASTSYMDNARPSFLKNPETGQPLEIDRFYREGVGFEYNGDQHYRPTAKYDQQAVRKQATRDAIKLGLSTKYGITIVTVVDRDLSIDSMIAKVPSSLSKRHLNRESLYLRKLDEICQEHAATMENIRRGR